MARALGQFIRHGISRAQPKEIQPGKKEIPNPEGGNPKPDEGESKLFSCTIQGDGRGIPVELKLTAGPAVAPR
jgi:hypothetical protein